LSTAGIDVEMPTAVLESSREVVTCIDVEAFRKLFAIYFGEQSRKKVRRKCKHLDRNLSIV
jgi:hypothetical protein